MLYTPLLYNVLTCPFSSVVRRDELFALVAQLVVLNLKRAGTTFAAESLASNVMTQAATIIKPNTKCNSCCPLLLITQSSMPYLRIPLQLDQHMRDYLSESPVIRF